MQQNRVHFESHEFEMDTTIYYKDHLIDRSINCLIMVVGLGMLVGPIWWLQYLSADQIDFESCLEAITTCVVLFAAFLNIVSNARVFEILAASAAYTAALVVFVQLLSSSSGGVNNK